MQTSFNPSGIEWVVFSLLLLVVVVILAIRWWRMPRISVPSCGCCRYDVTGLPSDVCPECGADLNTVGILEPGHRRPMALLTRFVLLTAVIAAAAAVTVRHIDARLPILRTFSTQIVLSSPQSDAYRSVDISGQKTSRMEDVTGIDTAHITLTRRDGSTTTMEFDLIARVLRYTAGDGSLVSAPVSAEGILQWMRSCGIAVNARWLAREAQVIAEDLNTSRYFSNPEATGIQSWTSSGSSMNARSPLRSSTHRQTIGAAPDPYRQLIIFAPFIAMWVIAAMVLLLTYRRPRRAAPGRKMEAAPAAAAGDESATLSAP